MVADDVQSNPVVRARTAVHELVAKSGGQSTFEGYDRAALPNDILLEAARRVLAREPKDVEEAWLTICQLL
jgi:hypothetical protein